MTAPRVSKTSSGDGRSAGEGRHRTASTGWGGGPRIRYNAGSSAKPAASGYSRYVGRVGALAVGLGVGAALASMPAVAFADSTGSAGSTASSSSAGSSSSSTSAAGGVSSGADASSSPSDAGASPSGQESSPASGLSGAQDSSSAGSDVDASEVEASEVDGSDVEASEVGASEVDGLDLDASGVDASEVEASEVDGLDVDASDVGSSGAGSSGAYASGAGSSGAYASDVGSSGVEVSDIGADGDASDFDAAMSDFDAADESAVASNGSDSSTLAGAGGASPSAPAEAAVASVAPVASVSGEAQISEQVAVDRVSRSGVGEQDSSDGLDVPAAALGLATLGFAARREASSGAATGASQQAVAELADPADANVLLIAIDGTRLSAILEDPANVNLFALMAGGDIVTPDATTAIVGGTTAASTIVGHSTISLPSFTAIMNGVWGETAGVINNVYYAETADEYPTVFNTLETTFGDNIQTMAIANWIGTAAISDAESLGVAGADVVQYVEAFENDPTWTQRDNRVGELTVQAIEGTNPGCEGACPVPDFLFSYFGGVDESGHEFGGGSAEYAEALRNVDENIGEIMEAVIASGEDWTVLVTTDHGQSTTAIGAIAHGFQSPVETTTFVIAWDGENGTPIFEPGAMNNQYSIVDMSPTVLDIFGGPDLPPTWYEGVPLSDHDASTVKPTDPDGLRVALLDAIGMYGYPDILTQGSQAWRTITATIPYLVYETTNDIVSAVEGFLPSSLSWLITVPVQFIGDLLYTATNFPARIFAMITGVDTSIFPLLPPPVPSPPVAPPPPMSPNVLANPGADSCVWSLSGTAGTASLSSSQTSSPTIGLNSRPTPLAANSC